MTVIVVSLSGVTSKVTASPDARCVAPEAVMTAVGAFGSRRRNGGGRDAGHHGRGVVKGSARERGREGYSLRVRADSVAPTATTAAAGSL